MRFPVLRTIVGVGLGLLASCHDGTAADRIGVGAECSMTNDCPTYSTDAGAVHLECLTEFAGGYCGLTPCARTLDCPDGSICVAHTNGINYCFRRCTDKPECNLRRSPDNQSNCSANFTWATPSDDDGSKACIPPSGV